MYFAWIGPVQRKPSPLIPLTDYLRMHNVMRSVLDSLDARTAHACLFFSVAGATLLREFYNKDARPVIGAMVLLVNDAQRNALTFATLEDGKLNSTKAAFHAWIECAGYVIDFMAPLFPENSAAAGHPSIAPSRMLQKRLEAMSISHEHLDQPGDFYLESNSALAADLLQSFYRKPAGSDLVNICKHWYRRPPRAIASETLMQDDLGIVTRIKLKSSPVSGVW